MRGEQTRVELLAALVAAAVVVVLTEDWVGHEPQEKVTQAETPMQRAGIQRPAAAAAVLVR